MSLKTIGTLTVIALSLSACGSSGTSSTFKPGNNTTVEQTEAEKAAAEKAAAEKAAAEKAAAEKAAAEKAAAEKAAAEKAAAEKAAAEKAAAEKAAAEKAAAEKAAAEKAAAEKAAAEKAAAEKAAAEKAAAEKAAAEKAAAEKAAAEKLEAERIAARKVELAQSAYDAGLSEELAQKFADNNVEISESDLDTELANFINDEVIDAKGGYYSSGFSQRNGGVSSASSVSTSIINGSVRKYGQERKSYSYEKIYNQPYSVVIGGGMVDELTTYSGYYSSSNIDKTFSLSKIAGLVTQDHAIPAIGSATYIGNAMNAAGALGNLSYTIDFGTRKGFGEISGLSSSDASADILAVSPISLLEGTLAKINLNGQSVTGIRGVARAGDGDAWGYQNGTYSLGLFGPKAEEVAGSALFDGVGDDGKIGFGGQRGEISK